MLAQEEPESFELAVVAFFIWRLIRVVLVAVRYRVERRVARGPLPAVVDVQDVVQVLTVAA